jgi:hypothetical protein
VSGVDSREAGVLEIFVFASLSADQDINLPVSAIFLLFDFREEVRSMR